LVVCQVLNASSGEWETKTEGEDFTVDRRNGKVTFVQAPPSSEL